MQLNHIKNANKSFWYFAFAGLCSLFIGLGLCRFAYTPIIPALINQHWVTQTGASYLGSINFLGYFIGAYLGQQANKYFEIPSVIKFNLILSIISLAACAINLGFMWLGFWRFLAGVTGAMLMVLTPSTILKKVPVEYRGKMSGVMFTGIGMGAVISGILVPYIATTSIMITWLLLAILALIATSIAWSAFSKNHFLILPIATHQQNYNNHLYVIVLLMIAYGFYAIGQIPHSLFLVDYVHRELDLSLMTSGMFWTAFGIASLGGPFVAGFMADKIGTYSALLIAFSLCFLAILMVVLDKIIILYVLSSFLMGAFLPGIVTLMSLRLVELVGTEKHPNYWGKVTLCFALTQAIGAYVMSFLLHRGVSYRGCFMLAGGAFLLGLIVVAFAKKSFPNKLQADLLSNPQQNTAKFLD